MVEEWIIYLLISLARFFQQEKKYGETGRNNESFLHLRL